MGFPQVIITAGPVDASPNLIVINPDEGSISRGHRSVVYGRNFGRPSRGFYAAKLLIERAPHPVHSRSLLAAMYGEDEAQWPADRHNAITARMADLRHRASLRLGLVLTRAGHTSYALQDRMDAAAAAPPPEGNEGEAKLAMGSARRNHRYSALRRYAFKLMPEDAEAVRKLAREHKVSFAEAARTLITWGLESWKGDAA